jgi:hypothetical protein
MADFLAGFDFDKLPSAEHVGAYFGTSDGYSMVDGDGFRSSLTMYYPPR